MARFFISYSRTDEVVATELANRLRQGNHQVFQDIHGIHAGADWERELQKQVKSADILLVIVSKASNESEWVRREINSAIDHRKTIIPVILNTSKLPPHLTKYNALSLRYTDSTTYSFSELLLGIERSLQTISKRGNTLTLVAVVFIVFIIIIGVTVLLFNGDDDSGKSDHTSTPSQTLTNTATHTPSTTPTETLMDTPTQTFTPSDTPTETSTGTATSTPTHIPTETSTPTPSSTFTATITLVVTDTPIPALPCPATVMSATGATVVNVHQAANTASRIAATVRPGDKITLISRAPNGEWYEIRNSSNRLLGWLESKNIVKDSTCP